MKTQTPIERLIQHLGGQAGVARALGVSQPTVFGWKAGLHGMNAVTAMRAERLTGIPAVELCPKLAEA